MRKIFTILSLAFCITTMGQNKCLHYTSSGVDLVEVPVNSTLNFQNDFTISVKVNFLNVNFWNMLFCYSKYGGLEYSYTGTNSNNPKTLQFGTDGSAANVATAQSWTPVNGQWYHIVLTKQGTKYSTYVDGSLLGTSTSTAAIPDYSANKFRIGNYMNSGLFFMGRMDEVSIWTSPLSAKFIKDTLSKPLVGNEKGLILYYDMDTTGTGQGIKVRNKAIATGKALDGVTVGKSSSPYFEQNSGIARITEPETMIFPNPSNGSFQMDIPSEFDEISIYNMNGECIRTILYKGSTHITIDLNEAAKGIYCYRIALKNQSPVTGKILIE